MTRRLLNVCEEETEAADPDAVDFPGHNMQLRRAPGLAAAHAMAATPGGGGGGGGGANASFNQPLLSYASTTAMAPSFQDSLALELEALQQQQQQQQQQQDSGSRQLDPRAMAALVERRAAAERARRPGVAVPQVRCCCSPAMTSAFSFFY